MSGIHCFGDVSHSMDSIGSDLMNSSSFEIANSMIHSDIDALHLTQTRDVMTDENNTDSETYHQNIESTSIEYVVDSNRIVVSVEDCSNESFNDLVNHVTNGSNNLTDGSVGTVSTRLRRRKATQPQRLVYCDLDFNLNDEQNFNNNNQNSINCNQINDQNVNNGSNEDHNQYCIDDQKHDEGIGLSSLDESLDEEEDEGEDKNEVKPKKTTKGFECEICGTFWNSKTRLKSHYRTHGASKHLKCDICGKLFGWEYSWKTHMLAHSEDNPNKCPHCGLKLFNKTALNNHIKRIHDNPERPFKCTVCAKCFISKSELNQHIQIHNDSKNFMCEQCGKTFRSKSYLERHYKTHSGIKPFKCEFCGKLLADKTGFTAHVRSHKGERPFQCDICGKKYTIKRHLTSHMIIHSDLRPFKCEQCGKTFRSRTNFRMHKDSHLGVKRWECRFCQRTFLSQGNMAKHVRRHIGDRKHKCEVCGKAFIEKQELKNHSKMHSNNELTLKKSIESNGTDIQIQFLPQITVSDVSTLSSTNSTNSDTNIETTITDSLINGNINNESETELNVEMSSVGAHSSLLSLSSPLTISLPSLASNLCLPLTASIHPLTSINSTQTYQTVDNTNTGAIDLNVSQLSFCDFQRSDSNNRSFYSSNPINSSRSPTDETVQTFFNSSQSTNPYVTDTQNTYQTIHCSLCSDLFVSINNLRQHLIDFHRVEPEKVIGMMY